MSLTTKPPSGDPGPRTDAAPTSGARPAPARPVLADTGGALRLLVEEIIAAASASLGPGSRPPPPGVAGEDPRQVATALLAWLRAAAGAGGLPADRLAQAVESGSARALEILARLPVGAAPAGDAARALRDLVLGGLGAEPVAGARSAELPPLPVLIEELRSAVVTELGTAPPPPRALSGEDPGNVAASLLRWLRAATASANVPLVRARVAIDRAFERTAATLAASGADPAAREPLERVRDVLMAAFEREHTTDPSPGVPSFRPDLPVPPLPRRARGTARPARAREAPEPEPIDERPPPPPEESSPPALDLKGPMELIRRYFEDFHSTSPGACAVHFVYPACAWLDGAWQGHADADALVRAAVAERAALTARGVAGGRILMLRVEPLGSSVALVHARTTRESAAGKLVEEVELACTTVHTAVGWRIAVLMRP